MGFRLFWSDPNQAEDGHRVYKSSSPMDPNNLPPPLATFGANVTQYDDGAVVQGQTYYYRVGAFLSSGVERVSAEIQALAEESGGLTYLFQPGDEGACYDIWDLGTLFQDEAGTLSAGVGDPVRTVLDKSGQGNHLKLPDAVVAPILETDGALYWLKANENRCDLAAIWTAFAQPNTTALGFRMNSTPNSNFGPRVFGKPSGIANYQMVYAGNSSDRMFAGSVTGDLLIDLTFDQVYFLEFNGASSTWQKNSGTINSAGNTGLDGNPGVILFADQGGGSAADMRFYGGIWISRLLTTTERSEVNTYLSQISGV